MNVTQVRWVLAATIVSESAWVFALLGVVGLAFSMGAGVLGWLAVLAIMSISAFYQLVTVPSDTEEAITFSWRTLGIAAAVVYVAVATEVGEGLLGTDLLWFFRFETWGSAANQPLMGTAAGALLWWRGSRLSSSTDLKESLSFSFRIGVVALAIAVIVDLAVDTNLGTFLPVFVFFAFGLAGLSVANLLPEGQQALGAGAWPKIIAAVVGPVLALGLVLSFVQERALDFLSKPVGFIWDVVIIVVLWGIIWPIIFLIAPLIDWLRGLIGLSGGAGSPDVNPPNPLDIQQEDLLQEFEEATGSNAWVVQVIGWVLVAVVAVVLIVLVARLSRRVIRRRRTVVLAERESIRGDSDFALDLAGMAWGMVPDWLKRGDRPPDFSLPKGPPGVVQALVFYYDLITLAEKWGYSRIPNETVTEFQWRLEKAFPRDLVRAATDAFNRACYGNVPSTQDQIAQMRSALKVAERAR